MYTLSQKQNSFDIKKLFLLGLLLTPVLTCGQETNKSSKPNKYVADVAKLAALPAPAPGGILMVGSSIFRKWTTCTQDLAPLPITNRAFGGSHTKDQLFFFDQIVPNSKASLVVWYCGSNDVKGKAPTESILANTKEWIEKTRVALPGVHILLVSVIKSPQKRDDGEAGQVDEVNKKLIELAGTIPDVTYADVNPVLETTTGEPVMECYVADRLHLTPKGYEQMITILRPVMEKEWKAAQSTASPTPAAGA
jgi:hypothetical protein